MPIQFDPVRHVFFRVKNHGHVYIAQPSRGSGDSSCQGYSGLPKLPKSILKLFSHVGKCHKQTIWIHMDWWFQFQSHPTWSLWGPAITTMGSLEAGVDLAPEAPPAVDLQAQMAAFSHQIELCFKQCQSLSRSAGARSARAEPKHAFRLEQCTSRLHRGAAGCCGRGWSDRETMQICLKVVDAHRCGRWIIKKIWGFRPWILGLHVLRQHHVIGVC